MDPTPGLLKQEINKTLEMQHDLAKWKLGVAAVLGAAAFGLSRDRPSYWLLLFIPFVCAYIDLYAYQYEFRIFVIARFLRENGNHSDDVLQRYEGVCETLRGEGVFSLGNWAGLGCSLFASVIGPAFYYLQGPHRPGDLLVSSGEALVIWIAGLLLIAFLWRYFQDQTKKISGEGNGRQADVAA